MIQLTDTERRAIIRRAASAIGELQEGEDAISVLSRIYCQNLPDKSPRQGELMARELVDWMNRFYRTVEQARKDPQTYASQALKEQIAWMSLEDQCSLLRQQIGICCKLEHARDLRDISLEALPEVQTEAQVSEAVRDQLLEEAAERLAGASRHYAFEEILTRDTVEDFQSISIVKTYIDPRLLQAITAMTAYTMVKKGELSGLPENVTLGQLTVGVCAQEEYREIICAAEMGCLAQSEAERRMRGVLVTVVVLLIAAAVATGGAMLWAKSKAYSMVPYAAMGGYILLWLSIVLSIWYSSMSEMVREESETIALVKLELELEQSESQTVRQEAPVTRQENSNRSWEETDETERKKQYLGH